MSAAVAALFVDERGVYSTFDDVELWGVARDARKYAGPHPVVAHPPCERWGRYWYGGPSCKERKKKGDDDGCFEAAINAVRAWGGVLEHPADSAAWKAFGLIAPPRAGSWIAAGDWVGWTCCVEQGHYGHRARKATWLYAARVELPSLTWGKSNAQVKFEQGFHSADERRERRDRTRGVVECLSHRERAATPRPFAEVLLAIARTSGEHRAINDNARHPVGPTLATTLRAPLHRD